MTEYEQVRLGDFVIRTKTDGTGKLIKGEVGLVLRKVEARLPKDSSLWLILDEHGKTVEWSNGNFRRLENEQAG